MKSKKGIMIPRNKQVVDAMSRKSGPHASKKYTKRDRVRSVNVIKDYLIEKDM